MANSQFIVAPKQKRTVPPEMKRIAKAMKSKKKRYGYKNATGGYRGS